ncbi:hypothetical protein NDU88_001526 [Pleurodeles waltl]|uniref:Uncharacterized protein n=1 Tax=Pleurodeles waltl TaxID=8319 RepID=A0AAV7KSW2_PLEWA|nr:hypothetical protein NDU88_001526 [Pleurodeles waltl]
MSASIYAALQAAGSKLPAPGSESITTRHGLPKSKEPEQKCAEAKAKALSRKTQKIRQEEEPQRGLLRFRRKYHLAQALPLKPSVLRRTGGLDGPVGKKRGQPQSVSAQRVGPEPGSHRRIDSYWRAWACGYGAAQTRDAFLGCP